MLDFTSKLEQACYVYIFILTKTMFKQAIQLYWMTTARWLVLTAYAYSLYVHSLLEINITVCFRLEVASFFVAALVLLLLMIRLFLMLLCCCFWVCWWGYLLLFSCDQYCYCLSLGISFCPLRAPGVYLDSRALFVFFRSDWYPHLAPEFGYHEARDIKWINGYRMSEQL